MMLDGIRDHYNKMPIDRLGGIGEMSCVPLALPVPFFGSSVEVQGGAGPFEAVVNVL